MHPMHNGGHEVYRKGQIQIHFWIIDKIMSSCAYLQRRQHKDKHIPTKHEDMRTKSILNSTQSYITNDSKKE